MTWVQVYLYGLPVLAAAVVYWLVPQTRTPPRIYMLLALGVAVPLTLWLTPRGWSLPHHYLVTLPPWGIWLQVGIFAALFSTFFILRKRGLDKLATYTSLAISAFIFFWIFCVKVA